MARERIQIGVGRVQDAADEVERRRAGLEVEVVDVEGPVVLIRIREVLEELAAERVVQVGICPGLIGGADDPRVRIRTHRH